MSDLNKRMDQLRATVTAKTEERKQQEDLRRLAIRAQKGRDWDKVLAEAPDEAEFVTQMGKAFGKLDLVLIQKNGNTILDSRKYDSLHDATQHRGQAQTGLRDYRKGS
jgi:hypothetical protein